MTGDIWDKFESLFDLNPLAKLEMFNDFSYNECKARFFVKAKEGSQPWMEEQDKAGNKSSQSELAFYHISQRNKDDQFSMENVKLVHVRTAKFLLVMCKDEESDLNIANPSHLHKKKGFISPEYFKDNIMVDVLDFVEKGCENRHKFYGILTNMFIIFATIN